VRPSAFDAAVGAGDAGSLSLLGSFFPMGTSANFWCHSGAGRSAGWNPESRLFAPKLDSGFGASLRTAPE
jgi:hypothetical protein